MRSKQEIWNNTLEAKRRDWLGSFILEARRKYAVMHYEQLPEYVKMIVESRIKDDE